MLGRDRTTVDPNEELQFHLDMEVEAGLTTGSVAGGRPAPRAAARRSGLGRHWSPTREALGLRWLDGLAGRPPPRRPRADPQPRIRHRRRRSCSRRRRGQHTHLLHARRRRAARAAVSVAGTAGATLRREPRRRPSFRCRSAIISTTATHAESLDGWRCTPARTWSSPPSTASPSGYRRRDHVRSTSRCSDAHRMLGRAFTDADLRGKAPARHPQRSPVASSTSTPTRRSSAGPSGSIASRGRSSASRPKASSTSGGDYRSPLQGETVDIWLPLALEGSEGDAPLQPLLQCDRAHPRRGHRGAGAAGTRTARRGDTSTLS